MFRTKANELQSYRWSTLLVDFSRPDSKIRLPRLRVQSLHGFDGTQRLSSVLGSSLYAPNATDQYNATHPIEPTNTAH
jgi:hypothetical protein